MINLDKFKINERVGVNIGNIIADKLNWNPKWKIEKRGETGGLIDIVTFDGNLMLDEGANLTLSLLIGGTGTSLNNVNVYMGIGDSTTAESATQTGLQATTNKVYVGMESGYPSKNESLKQVTFRSVFGSAVGNFAWQEFTIANGNSDSAVNLNRKVSNQGTKVSGQTWTLDFIISIS